MSDQTPKKAEQISAAGLQAQLKTILLRLEHQLKEALGPHTIQQMRQHGLDLVGSCKKVATRLAEEINREFSLYQEYSELEFTSSHSCYKNVDKPQYVEDGYIVLHLSEKQILRYFLREKHTYQLVLEELINYIVFCVKKSYYRIEQSWQEFSNHYMLPSSDISLREPDTLSSASRQIAQKHQRMQQLQKIAPGFWQENFTQALEQLSISPQNTPLETQDSLKISSILAELPREQLFEDVRRKLEYSLERCSLSLEAASAKFCCRYTEYPRAQLAPDEEAPDELIWLLYEDKQRQTAPEESFIPLSNHIRDLFQEIEKKTSLNRTFLFLCMFLYSVYQKIFKKTTEKSASLSASLLEQSPPSSEEILLLEDSPKTLEEEAFYREAELLLKILQQSEITLHYQLQYHSAPQHYRLHCRVRALRRELVALCRQPPLRETGLYLTASYRTVRRRRESYQLLRRVLEDFKKLCSYGWI